MPETPHVCEVLEDGTVQTSTVLIAKTPIIDTSCIIPFGNGVSPLPTTFTVDVHARTSQRPAWFNTTQQIFLSQRLCASVNTSVSGSVVLVTLGKCNVSLGPNSTLSICPPVGNHMQWTCRH